MSTVYLANQMPLGRLVALKVLALPTDPEALQGLVQRFQLEAQALAQLTHPNIVVVHDYGETEDGRLFLAMEHLDGISLGELFRRGPLSVERALTLLLQVCAGLRYAHKRGVIHRDLKPSNVMIMVDDDGMEQIKIVDFGLAKFRESDTSITNPGIVLGSPQFMAPEQIRDEEIDPRADIYSFGVMLFRAVTGRYPFPAADAQSVLSAHLVRPAPRLCDATPEMVFPAALEEVVARCLRKSPVDRFANIGEVIEALSPLLGTDLKWSRSSLMSNPSMSSPSVSRAAMSNSSVSRAAMSNSSVSRAAMSSSSMSRASMSRPTMSRASMSRPSMSRPDIPRRHATGALSIKALWGILGLATAMSASMAVVAVVLLLYVGWELNQSASLAEAVSNVPPEAERTEPLVEVAPPPAPISGGAADAGADPAAPEEADPRQEPAPPPKLGKGKPTPKAAQPQPSSPQPPAPRSEPAARESAPAPVPVGYFGLPEDLVETPQSP